MSARSATIFGIGISNITSLRNWLEILKIKTNILSFLKEGDCLQSTDIYIIPVVESFYFGINKLHKKGIYDLTMIQKAKNSVIIS